MSRPKMEADVESPEEKNILYDLTIQTEWQLDPEAVFRPTRERSQVSFSGRLTSSATRTAWTFLRTVGVPVGSGSPCLLPPALVKLINSHLSWHFDVSKDGHHVALLQDQSLEVRSSRDDFSTHISKWSVSKDLHPQWRSLAWNGDGDMIAYSTSMGSVTIYDIVGTKICYIQSFQIPHPTAPIDLSSAVCSLIFREVNDLHKDRDWDTELMIVNFKGTLKNYTISRSGEARLLHQFSFGSQYSHGISSVVYSPAQSVLYVGGGAEPASQRETDTPTAMQLGVTAWRILSDLPHYKLVTDYETDLQLAQRRSKLLKKLKHLYSWKSEEQDGIYKLCLSPSNQLLAAVHQSGSLTVLEAPSLRIRHTWEQEEQPAFNEVNQTIAENPKKSKHYKDYLTAFYLTDLNWWSDEAVILARGTGAITVSSVNSLKNLLGPSPEWFEGVPALSPAVNGGFLGLECECKYSQLKRHHVSDNDDNYEDSDDDVETTLVSRSAKYMRQALYYVTDSEKFQPPRKRPKLVTKTYRLVCLKSTTPEELYDRKIDNEEYGEALALAKAYQLDCDRVYQRQWRRTPVSVASIQDYLSKISKRSWVLHECLERVPENIDAMRELLQYGLRGTDLEALIAIGKGEDGGRFILCDRHDVYEDSIDPFDMQAVEESKDLEKKYVQDLLDQVDFKSLNLQQIELCRARAKLIQYLDRLATYEEILGGSHYAPDRYEPKFFQTFRSNNIVEQAVQYARDCDWQAVEILFTYHGTDVLPYRLAVLSNFLETYQPGEYKMLLPEISQTGDSVVDWVQQEWKTPDWCQQTACRSVIDPSPPDLGHFLYEDNPDLLKFRGNPLTSDQVLDWYRYRACEIEHLSRQIDHALELITIATNDKNVQGLEKLQDDLITMDTLVYDCNIDDSLTFQQFLDLSNIDRLQLHMSQSSEEMYSKNIKRWLVPFLQRCDKHEPGSFQTLMREYLVSLAKSDLSKCLKIFESCRADQPKPVIADEYLVMSMALECVYTCESCDQLGNAYGILECLPQRGFGIITEQSTKLHNQVDELECHLSAAEILEKHDLPQTIAFIRSTQHDVEEAKALFTKLTRKAGNRSTSLTDKEWKKLLQDLLAVREKVYQCLDSSVCYQIFVESLLCSSNPENIRLAGKMIERTSAESREPDYTLPDLEEDDIIKKVAYPRAVELVLTAAREYFDSSTNLTDVTMDLARACLGLIEDKPQSVSDELDLIDALALLDGFGVNILPLQVRMSTNRLDLVQKAISAKAFTYKNSQRLLKLGQLLKVEGNTKTERDGCILRLIAQAALKAKDIGVCYHTCQRLMDLGYPEVWRECKTLAELDDFHNIQAKTELLSFAVTHCSPEMIEPILRAKCLLETQTLYERVHSKMADRDSLSPIENPFTPKGAIQQTKEILSSTNKATRQVLSSVSNKDWWKKTLKGLHPLNKDSHHDNTDDRNQGYKMQGCHPFYEQGMDDCYINKAEVDYQALSASRPDIGGLHFSESLLYTAKLEETLSEGESYHPSTEVLLQLAQDALAVDSSLGLGYLMALPEASDADGTFQQNPGTDISLQLAAYYYALQMYSCLDQSTPANSKAVYHQSPMELVQKMRSHARYKEEAQETQSWDHRLRDLVHKLEHYSELLADYNQAQVLKKLDRGIDIGRFTVDTDYKKETILGLAMTQEDEVYEISVSLAQRYNLSLWEVYMCHLEHLFDSGLATSEIESRATALDILGTLQADSAAFYERMKAYVYPGIDGKDHARLHLYYSLLEASNTDTLITPSNHVSLLKKMKNIAPGLDYKQLTDGEHDPLEVLRPILTAENINTLAKLSAKLPDQHGGYLQPSVIYCGWAIQSFWQGGRKQGADGTDWVHRYEACGEYLQKLLPGDVLRFITAITFVADALEELAVDVRRQIIRRALKYSKQQLISSRKKKSEEPQGAVTWDAVVLRLQKSLEHMDRLNHSAIASLRDSQDSQLQGYAREFDLSQSQQDKLERLYLRMVLDGHTPQEVDDVITVVTAVTWTTRTAFMKSVQLVTRAIKNVSEADVLLKDQDVLKLLRTVVSQVSDHQQNGGDLVTSEDLMTLLRPFCADGTVAVEKRLEILTILEQCFHLEDSDLVLLTLYRTEAVVSTSWPNKQLTEDHIGTDLARSSLFKELLSESQGLEQFRSLRSLLQVWPQLEAGQSKRSEPADQPWCQLLCHLVQQCGAKSSSDVVSTVRSLQESSPLPDQCVLFLHDVLTNHQMSLVAVKCFLLSETDSLHLKAVELLKQVTEVPEDQDDSELFVLILQRHLAAHIVETLFYPKLVDFVLGNQSPGGTTPYHLSVETIANQLQDVGYEAEAMSLVTSHRGMHPSLRTFDAALGLLSRWFTR